MKGRTISISCGKWGGFYIHRGYTSRICLGFFAITYIPRDLDEVLEYLVLKEALHGHSE